MIHVLKHVESITQHRDRTLLEVGVASALFELVKAREVNLHKIVGEDDGRALERVTHVGTDGVRYADDNDDEALPVSARPEIAACVEKSQIVRRADPITGAFIHCFPIAVDRRVLGVLEVSCDHTLSEDDLGTAEGFLGLYRNYLSLLDYSERDTLTGMLNRKTFDESLSKILAGMAAMQAAENDPGNSRRRRQQDDGTHWLAVVDVDHFKRINDQFGHLYGDEVLILLARIMRESFRHQDKLFRFGGEEFVVTLRAASEDEVRTALERFRNTVEKHNFPQVGQVTVSAGHTLISTSDTIPEIVGRADEALYVAKENGRNQIASYEAALSSGKIVSREKPDNDIELF